MEQWVCRSKFVTGDKTGISVVRELVSQADAVMEDKTPDLGYFCYDDMPSGLLSRYPIPCTVWIIGWVKGLSIFRRKV